MKNSRLMTLALALSMPLGLSTAFADDEPGARGPSWSLEGTWVETVTPPVPWVPTHIALVSFAAGGVAISSSDRFLPPPIARSDVGNGSWARTGPREFASTFVAFTFDIAGQPLGAVKITSQKRLIDRNTFEGRAQLSLCDLNLNCQPPMPGATLRGKRLAVEP